MMIAPSYRCEASISFISPNTRQAVCLTHVKAVPHALDMHPSLDADRITIRYMVPWKASVIRQATVDLVFSHAVLANIVNLEHTYQACAQWLKPRGWMSHQIDLSSAYLAKVWNDHWTYRAGYGRSSWATGPFISIVNRAPTISVCYAPADLRS
jgi:hypothetical protein